MNPANRPLRKLPFARIAAEHFSPRPTAELLSLARDIQIHAHREGRSPHELLDDLEADAARLRRAA
jgi:hypothetical protein